MECKLRKQRTWLTLICVSLVVFGCSSSKKSSIQQESENKGMDVYLLIGQSNMQGVAPIEPLDTISLRNVFLFTDKNEWEFAKNYPDNGMNRYSTVKKKPITLFGPAYTFGREIAQYSNRTIGIVSNARGATRIDWWQKGYTGDNDYDLYEEAVKRTKIALESTPGATLKGILWHQGEANNGGGRHVNYMSKLQSLVTDLRKDFGDMNIPFIAAEVGTWNNRGENINPIIRSIKDHVSKTDWVSSTGLTSIDVDNNDPHFDNLSQRVLGSRYAVKAAELVYGINLSGVTVFSEPGFIGRSVLLGPGYYNSEDLEIKGIQMNEVASARVSDGYELIVYGKKRKSLFMEDIENMEETTMGSIRIRKKGHSW